jgi:nucleoside 2-deoxyribosyltransferase
MLKIYIAGPLFTPYERKHLEEIAAICGELGIKAYVPHRDGKLLIGEGDTASSKNIFDADVEAMKNSDIVIGVLNGPKVDDGTSWEIGHAFALGKLIFAIAEDTRIRVPNNINPMLLNSVKLTNSISELKAALADYLKSKSY